MREKPRSDRALRDSLSATSSTQALDQALVRSELHRVDDVGVNFGTRVAFCNHGFPVGQEVADPDELEDVRVVVVHVEHNFCARDQGVAGRAIDAENGVGVETGLAKLGNDVVTPLVHRAVEEHVDVFDRGRPRCV